MQQIFHALSQGVKCHDRNGFILIVVTYCHQGIW